MSHQLFSAFFFPAGHEAPSYRGDELPRFAQLQVAVMILVVKGLVALLLFVHGSSASCDYSRQYCGDIFIPYPFGTTPDCGLPDYRISCNASSSLTPGPVPFLQLPSTSITTKNGTSVLRQYELQVLRFVNAHTLHINGTDFKATSCESSTPGTASLSIPDTSPFVISSGNIFTVVGCSSSGNFSATKSTLAFDGECSNFCYNAGSFPFCNAYACCIIGFPQSGVKSIEIVGAGVGYKLFPGVCGYSTVLTPDTFETSAYGIPGAGQYRISLDWGIPYSSKLEASNCSTAKSFHSYACTNNSDCIEVGNIPGYVCNCSLEGYHGDGYRNGTGCENVNECAPGGTNNCVGSPYGTCTDLLGTYKCGCEDGAVGDGISPTKGGTGCTKTTNHTKTSVVVAGTSASTAAVVIVFGSLLWWFCKKRASRAKKSENFTKNGGHVLREFLGEGSDTLRLFSESELQRATQNYAVHLELGRGGYGTVYKGFLADGSVVAIKRSNHMDKEAEGHQFANEVIILSRLNHRNIMRLLGCCLETAVPLLVYEYIPNGNLLEHLQRKDGRFLSWENRLVVALESAEALAYLHSSTSPPIFHRDVKSSNILLDKTLTPKLADFGISRLLPTDQTHISTLVQGTLGYLDPEYFQTFQLTDKSDVYSFGVVLLELVTSLKPVAAERDEDDMNLVMMCMSRWGKGTFSTIIDRSMISADESPQLFSSIHRVVKLAFDCLHVDGQCRPSMKAVFEELLYIRGSRGVEAKGPVIGKEEPDEKYQEIEALIPYSHVQNSDGSLTLSTGPSFSSNVTGYRAMEMVFSGSYREGGR